MNRSTDSDPDPHAATLELLPWLVNGTADEQPLEPACEHLADCDECQSWLAFDERLQGALREDRVVDYSPHAAYASFVNRLDAEQARQQRWRFWRKPGRWQTWSRARLVKLALATQSAIIVVLATGLVLQSSTGEPGEYRTLSLPDRAAIGSSAVLLRLVVDETMSAAELRELLAATHARIVDGPTELGVFTIEVARVDLPVSDPVALARLLRTQPGVQFAEPILESHEER
jgi:hypothetical protein